LLPILENMDRLSNLYVQGREIIVIDYSHLKEAAMIDLAVLAKALIMKTPTPKLIISSFKNTFATPAFLRHMERESVEIKPFIARNALVGLNKPKMMILKGFNLLLDTDFRAFSTECEAIEYLIEEPVIEKLEPIFKR
jgi:hypothetical protein